MNKVDALIIGAGPSGSAAAYLLAIAGWSVALVEKSVFPRKKVCGEYLSASNLSLLERLGLKNAFLQHAGPEIKRVGLFADSVIINSKMPRFKNVAHGWGRALRREVLDTLLLDNAVSNGAAIYQPYIMTNIKKRDANFISRIKSKTSGSVIDIESRIVIAAHGSWEIGTLPTQAKRQPANSSDLLGLKAHFRNADLPPDLMPLIVFPGGYGGMVTCDGGFVSISCCVRNDCLQSLRGKSSAQKVGSIVQQHIFDNCRGVENALRRARRDGEWLAAGIIRPGIRAKNINGIFTIGNAAGESHPIIAEGISMALQSAGLLTQYLLEYEPDNLTEEALKKITDDYDKSWRQAFARRIRAADSFAKIAMSNRLQRVAAPVLKTFPSLLTLGARLSGKVNKVIV